MMLIKQGAGLRWLNSIKNGYAVFLLLLFIGLDCHWHPLYGGTYYLKKADLVASLIQIPTSNVSVSSSTIASSYLAGVAPIYNLNNTKVGTYSATFLSMQNADGIHTTISNYLSTDKTVLVQSRLIVTWFTPTKPINLELDSIINSMVTRYTVETEGKTFDLIVSSNGGRIYFKFLKKKYY